MVSQVRGMYVAKEITIRMYRNVVWDAIEVSDAFNIIWVENNIMWLQMHLLC